MVRNRERSGAPAGHQTGCGQTSEQVSFGERNHVLPRYDQVIEHTDVNESQRVFQSLGDEFVRLARFGDATGMIMQEYAGGRITQQRLLDHLAWMDAGAIDGSPEEFLAFDNAMAIVEMDNGKRLIVSCAKNESSGTPSPLSATITSRRVAFSPPHAD